MIQHPLALPPQRQLPPHAPEDDEEYDDEPDIEVQELEEEVDLRGVQNEASQIYHPSVVQQSSYEIEPIKIIYDASRDESLPQLVFYVMNTPMSREAKMRLIAQAACYLSKNHVYSNLVDVRDYMAAQDDFELSKVLARFGLTSFDRNVDYLEAVSLIEAEHSIRLRRSRDALNLKQLNTQRSENVSYDNPVAQRDERKLRQKLPLIGSYM